MASRAIARISSGAFGTDTSDGFGALQKRGVVAHVPAEECLSWVTPGKTRVEHNESALPRAADVRADVAQGLRRANCGQPPDRVLLAIDLADWECRGVA